VLIAAGNSRDPQFIDQCQRLAEDVSPDVRGMAIWALSRLMDDAMFKAYAARRHTESDPDVLAEWDMAGV
jgi:epoxyqueuosine reductase